MELETLIDEYSMKKYFNDEEIKLLRKALKVSAIVRGNPNNMGWEWNHDTTKMDLRRSVTDMDGDSIFVSETPIYVDDDVEKSIVTAHNVVPILLIELVKKVIDRAESEETSMRLVGY